MRFRIVAKCPNCNRKPHIAESAASGLQTAFCCRFASGKPTRDGCIIAWNELIKRHYHESCA